jgi:hypothetical protein
MEQYPLIKVFEGSDKLIYSMAYAYPDKVMQYAQKFIGNGLIEFVEMDFEEYTTLFTETKSIPLTMKNYQTIRNKIFDVAETIADKHRYVYFFLVGLLNNILKESIHAQNKFEDALLRPLSTCIQELEHILELQEVCTKAVTTCLDKESRSDKEMSQRLYAFVSEYPGFAEAAVKIKYELLPRKNGKVDMDTLKDIHDWNLREADELLEIMHQDGEGVSLMPYYLFEYLDEMLYFEFTEMLKNAQFVKRCKLCSRYFVLTDKRKRDFCDRPYKGNRTCKQVGAKLFYDQGMQGNDYLLAFLTKYNKVYSRRYRASGKLPEELSGKDMSSEEYSRWAKLARQARSDYLDGKITGEEMLAKIKID